MEVAIILAWGIGILYSLWLIFQIIGYVGLCNMFPEGFRWYTYPLAIASIVLYTVLILVNPF
jgi:hypothetical protein